jgi:hypothetical protein
LRFESDVKAYRTWPGVLTDSSVIFRLGREVRLQFENRVRRMIAMASAVIVIWLVVLRSNSLSGFVAQCKASHITWLVRMRYWKHAPIHDD